MSTQLSSDCQQSLTQLFAQLQTTLEKNSREDANWLQQRQSLTLANALLRNLQGRSEQTSKHVVVVGPTQVGKSTVINHLLGSKQAGVSALAGYTRHAQGFTSGSSEVGQFEALFPNWRLVKQNELDTNNTRQFSVTRSVGGNNDTPEHVVYWDTPDFDSVSSRSYRTIVPNLSAIASVLVLVLSKEKYADNSVWEFLKLLAPLQLPLIICLNKADAAHEEVITTEIKERLNDLNCKHQAIITLPWQDSDTSMPSESIKALTHSVTSTLTENHHSPRLAAYFRDHWQDWLTPVIAEHQARTEWHASVEQASEQLLAYYREHYLQQTRYSEALQRAISKLLELLEIPILASTLGTLRKVITWPVRTLGKTILDSVSDKQEKTQTNEVIILTEAYQNALTELIDKTQHVKHQDHPQQKIWWESIKKSLDQQQHDLQHLAVDSIAELQDSFEPEIDAAANRLYKKLQEQPATLNSLRAARVTTDAAALAVAFHTGGLSATDLVLAPALLSVTSLLAESAVGQHMKVIEKELKEKQFLQVQSNLVTPCLKQPMHGLSEQLTSENLYNISDADVSAAEHCLSELN